MNLLHANTNSSLARRRSQLRYQITSPVTRCGTFPASPHAGGLHHRWLPHRRLASQELLVHSPVRPASVRPERADEDVPPEGLHRRLGARRRERRRLVHLRALLALDRLDLLRRQQVQLLAELPEALYGVALLRERQGVGRRRGERLESATEDLAGRRGAGRASGSPPHKNASAGPRVRDEDSLPARATSVSPRHRGGSPRRDASNLPSSHLAHAGDLIAGAVRAARVGHGVSVVAVGVHLLRTRGRTRGRGEPGPWAAAGGRQHGGTRGQRGERRVGAPG